jgi:hypothetical protein
MCSVHGYVCVLSSLKEVCKFNKFYDIDRLFKGFIAPLKTTERNN